MTNTSLKAQIDSQITNETTPLGITPAEVGGNLKSVVDYIDQQVPFKIMHGLITQEGTGVPTVAYLKNDTGITLSLSRTSIGRYSATLSAGITPSKVSLIVGSGTSDTIVNMNFLSNTVISISTFVNEAGTNNYYDDNLYNHPFKLEIYP